MVILLLLLGTAAILVRHKFRHETPIAVGDSIWRLTYSVGFHARKNDAKLHVSLPLDTLHARVFNLPKTLNPDLTVEQVRSPEGETRGILVKAPKPGPHQLTVQIDIHLSDRPGWRANLPSASLSSQSRAHFLRDEQGIEASDAAVRKTLEQLRSGQGSKAELLDRIFAHCVFDIDPGGENDPHTAAAALQKGVASPLGRARAMDGPVPGGQDSRAS